jgi:vacuolar protein sorting-associated protein 26
MLVKIKLKYMQLDIIKRECVGQGANTTIENETIAKFEVMDGCPRKGEVIPIRLYLSGYELSPSLKDISGKFSVKHFLNLILVDEDDRRYFK